MKSIFETAPAFRAEAARQGLIVDSFWPKNKDERRFWYDLNQGQFYSDPDPATILRILALAASISDGEQNAMLWLVAKRSDIAEKVQVNWQRGYYVANRDDPNWVTLRDWLAEQGHPYSPEGK